MVRGKPKCGSSGCGSGALLLPVVRPPLIKRFRPMSLIFAFYRTD